MRVAADAGDADSFAFELLQLGDVRLGQDALGHDVLDAADEHHVRGAVDVGVDDADPAQQTDLDVAAEKRRGRRRRRRYIHKLQIDVVFFKKPEIFGNPRHRVRHRMRGIKRHELVRRRSCVRQRQASDH